MAGMQQKTGFEVIMAYVILKSEDEWQPGRWLRVVGPDGQLWCETSSLSEAREAMRPSDKLYRLWYREEREWREVDG